MENTTNSSAKQAATDHIKREMGVMEAVADLIRPFDHAARHRMLIYIMESMVIAECETAHGPRVKTFDIADLFRQAASK